ncbi:MAG: LLM class flavin-dependent oxidoreductase, partial [Acidimicrobiales bacterium]
AQDSLIVGSPETCLEKLRAYAALGIDRMMCLQQIGGIAHQKVTRSIQLIGELIPDLDRG